MEIVIKIPNNAFKNGICEGDTDRIVRAIVDYAGCCSAELLNILSTAIPLPKGHGDLVDKSKICKAIYAEEDNCTGMGMTFEEMEAYNDGIDDMYRLVQGAPTIIEADMEVDE